MSNEVEFNSLTKDDVKIRFEEPSRIPSKPSDAEVAGHKKTRLALVVVFAVVVIAMVVVAVIIIIVAPRCIKEAVPEEKKGNDTLKGNDTATDESWWKSAVIYQVYPRSFKDSNGDGNGDLKGITNKMDYLGDLGVQALWLTPIFQSPWADGGYDISNYTAIDKKFGTMAEFDDFIKEAHKKGIKVIVGFVPNHTSNKHPWFEASKKSKAKENKFRDYYIWRDGAAEKNGTKPPNNWISYFGGSAWTYDNTTEQYYLHQFYEGEPDLNLRNEVVKKELKDVLKFWLGKGVDGFRFAGVQFLLEDEKFGDEPTNPNYNASIDLKYDMLRHTLTHDLPDDRALVKEFQQVLDEHKGSHPVLIVDVRGAYDSTSKYYEVSDIPFNFGLIDKVNRQGMTLAQGIQKTVEEYMATVPKGRTPNWVIGNHDVVRVGSRVGEDNRHAMNVLALTLPGVVTSYYGEEIGMLNGNVSTSEPRDNERTPMQWNKEKDAGFTTGKPWLEVASDYQTNNVDTEKGDGESFYSKYKELVKLRNETAFVSGDLKIVHSDIHVFSYVRTYEKDYFLVVINFGVKVWDGDLEKVSGRGTVVFDSESKLLGEKMDVNKIKLNVGQAVVVKISADTWFFNKN